MPRHHFPSDRHTPHGIVDAREDAAAQHAQEVRRAWGVWLGRGEWTHFVTLSAAFSISTADLKRRFVHGYVRNLARVAQRRVPWFYAIELGAVADRPHVHALLAGTERLSIAEVRRGWKFGHTHASVYDAERGAAFYVTKDLMADPDLHDLSARVPGLRERAA
jgi:hypothetical protein